MVPPVARMTTCGLFWAIAALLRITAEIMANTQRITVFFNKAFLLYWS
jgi:hypothetical protein